MLKKRKIKVYVDGPNIDQIKSIDNVDGYTFNPSLFKKLGAKDYLEFTKNILKYTSDKPVSIEVFADDEENCYRQSKIIKDLSKNIYVKIPITYTNGSSTKKLIDRLTKENIKLNITAIFTLQQVKTVLDSLKNSKNILSIFSGRIYDIGLDAEKIFSEISDYVHANSSCETLWASCRMAYDLITATKCRADIITMSPDLIKKLKNFGKTCEDYSIETVKTFYQDAKESGFKI